MASVLTQEQIDQINNAQTRLANGELANGAPNVQVASPPPSTGIRQNPDGSFVIPPTASPAEVSAFIMKLNAPKTAAPTETPAQPVAVTPATAPSVAPPTPPVAPVAAAPPAAPVAETPVMTPPAAPQPTTAAPVAPPVAVEPQPVATPETETSEEVEGEDLSPNEQRDAVEAARVDVTGNPQQTWEALFIQTYRKAFAEKRGMTEFARALGIKKEDAIAQLDQLNAGFKALGFPLLPVLPQAGEVDQAQLLQLVQDFRAKPEIMEKFDPEHLKRQTRGKRVAART